MHWQKANYDEAIYSITVWVLSSDMDVFYSRGLNNKRNLIHERALRSTYNDKSSSYGELLTKNRSVTILHRNIRQENFTK